MLQPKDIDGLNGWTTKPVCMLSTRDPLQTKGHIQTESEGTENYIPCKWKSKESWSSNSHIRQNGLQIKDYYKRQRRTLHNDQGINPRRSDNSCKYLSTQQRITTIHKQTLTDIKGEIISNTKIVGTVTPYFHQWTDHPK